MKFTHFPFKSSLLACSIALLAACNSITYHPTKTIEKIDPQKGISFRKCDAAGITKENLVIMTFSGGGSRAASLGYGVLEQFKMSQCVQQRKVAPYCKILILYGVSGGSVLAAYFALEGQDIIPKFNNSFEKNFQKKSHQ